MGSGEGAGCDGSPPAGHFMIAKIDASACTSDLEPHAGVSILPIGSHRLCGACIAITKGDWTDTPRWSAQVTRLILAGDVGRVILENRDFSCVFERAVT